MWIEIFITCDTSHIPQLSTRKLMIVSEGDQSFQGFLQKYTHTYFFRGRTKKEIPVRCPSAIITVMLECYSLTTVYKYKSCDQSYNPLAYTLHSVELLQKAI